MSCRKLFTAWHHWSIGHVVPRRTARRHASHTGYVRCMERERWVPMLGRSCSSFPPGGCSVVVFDPTDGHLIGASSEATADIRDLATAAFEEHAAALSIAIGSRSDYWWDDISADSGRSLVSGGLIWEPGRAEAALIIGIEPADAQQHEPFEPVPVSASTAVHVMLDDQLRCIFYDPRLGAIGLYPEAYVGVHAWPTSHPADLASAVPLIEQVIAGTAVEAEYVLRCAGPLGRWYNQHATFRPIIGHSIGYLITIRALGARRKEIDTTLLTDRELEVIADVFSGLTIGNIARRYDVSERTVRNQLSTVYGKLAVGSATELLSAYDPPSRVLGQQLGVRPVPLVAVPEPTIE